MKTKRNSKKIFEALVLIVVLAFSWCSANAATRYVTSQYSTIQAAVDAAVNGDEVVVADGTYTGTGNRDIDFLGKAITVRSENGPETCIIDCQGTDADPHRGFYFHTGEDASSILNGLTITNGRTYWDNQNGAGIYILECSPTIRNCVITGNSALWSGGGITCYYGSPTIVNCTISDNIARDPSLTASGGGIVAGAGNPTIINCIISNNTSRYGGGGLVISGGTITNCIISGNAAYEVDDGSGGFGGGSQPFWM